VYAKSTAELKLALDSAIAQSEVCTQRIAQRITESKQKWLHFFGWSLVSVLT